MRISHASNDYYRGLSNVLFVILTVKEVIDGGLFVEAVMNVLTHCVVLPSSACSAVDVAGALLELVR